MPQPLGPAMLANLDTQLQSGMIDQPTYDARKIEVEELIRKGKAYSLSPREKTLRGVAAAIVLVLGVFIWYAMASQGQPSFVGVIVALAAIIYGIARLAVTLRH